MLVGIGCNQKGDSVFAGRLAAEQAVEQSGEPAITFLFTTENYAQELVLQAVKEVIGKSKLVGLCTPGIITRDGVLEKGVGVCTISDSEMQVATCLQEDVNLSPWESGEEAGRKLRASGIDSGTVFVFPDGFVTNISDLIKGMYNALGPNFTYIGGGTGDNLKFFKTYQFTEQGVSSNALAAALVKGINFQIGIGHGWKPVGQPMVITKASGKKVYEIDGRPAFEVYSECLGGIDKESFPSYGMKYPLGIPAVGGHFLIRDPLKVEEDNSIVFVTEVPQNTVVTLMEGTVGNLITTAGEVASSAVSGLTSPGIIFLFDCISRYLLMGKEFEQELKEVMNVVG
ncbi:MAG: FIST C-terminal domain-containing protein, partial [Thermoanaerobacteraceae bacterium]|nr:FIST C-terminal domain-containing protein [Thermoanaerobacteraceae bacterium]